MYRILYVDDSQINLEHFGDIFAEEFEVSLEQNPINAIDKVTEEKFDAIILDIHMPVLNGFDLLKKLKAYKLTNDCPVLFFTSDSTDGATIKGLKTGCDDYLVRSMVPQELFLRIKNKIEKYKSFTDDETILGSLVINKKSMLAFKDGVKLPLTATEFKILATLVQNQGKLITRDDLSQMIWGKTTVQHGTLNTHITNLRTKLGDFDYKISSVKGRGVVLKEPIAN